MAEFVAPFPYFGGKRPVLQGDGAGKANRHRETVWFSPHCLTDPTPTLFDPEESNA